MDGVVRKLELQDLDDPAAADAVGVLEDGGVVLFPQLPFGLDTGERAFLDPGVLRPGVKNVSLDPATGALGGTGLEGAAHHALAACLARYARFADAVLGRIAPSYVSGLQRRRTSFRPAPVETRVLSPRKDDRRLHTDAFPANPVQGRRILRVFTNVDPEGRPRVWEVGEESVADLVRRYRPGFRDPVAAGLRSRMGLTKGRRTAYDAAMLQLHDKAKLDAGWQATAARTKLAFSPGSTWVVFTDGALHAALSGQHAFEQTYLLPVAAMATPDASPLRVLESAAGRSLV